MIGSLWHAGVGIDPGRLIDDTDTAYYLVVRAAYERFLELNARQAAEERAEIAAASGH